VDNVEILKSICKSLIRISHRIPLIFPIHPRTLKNLLKNGLMDSLVESVSLYPVEPLNYIRFMNLVFNCRLAITDSGGIQEETTYLGIPCLTMRPNTERPITIKQGTNQLCTHKNIENRVDKILSEGANKSRTPEYWDGRTADRVVKSIDILLQKSNKSDFWVKVGSDKRRASREEFRRLMQASGGMYADEMAIAGTGTDDVDMYSFRRFYEEQYGMAIEEIGLPEDRIMSNLKLMEGDCLTLAGLLFFAKQPELLKPQYLVKAVAFAGNDIGGNEYLDSEDIGGTLPVVFKGGMVFLKRNLRKKQKGQSFNFPGILELPEIALEEAFVNALIHRDYFINSGVRLFVFDNRVEIISPGRLPNTVTTENIKHGIQMVRNPILISFVSKLKIPYRGIGSGVIRMINECRNAGIPDPELLEDKAAELFKVIFLRK